MWAHSRRTRRCPDPRSPRMRHMAASPASCAAPGRSRRRDPGRRGARPGSLRCAARTSGSEFAPHGIEDRRGGPRARVTQSPVRRRGTWAPAPRDRNRGRRPCRRDPTRCSAASVPTYTPAGGGRSGPAPVTSTAGRLAAASSSSRSLVTPGRRLANRPPPQCRQTWGRIVPHRRHLRRSSSSSTTAASQRSHLVSSRHCRHASRRARPVVLLMHTTVRAGSRRCAMSSAVTSDRFHGSTSLRSMTSTIGQPARSRSRGGRVNGPHSSAVSVGHGDTSNNRAPARRHRSTSTSRACQVGEPSSWSASSCSSRTTAAAMPGHGAHAAVRPPITTSTPAAAAAQSSGISATDRPERRNRAASSIARSTDGTTTSDGPMAAALSTAGRGSLAGGSRSTPPPCSRIAVEAGERGSTTGRVRRGAGVPVTARCGDAALRKWRRRARPPHRGPRRQFDQIAVGSMSGHLRHRLQPVRVERVGRVELRRPNPRLVGRAVRRGRSTLRSRSRRARRERDSRTACRVP